MPSWRYHGPNPDYPCLVVILGFLALLAAIAAGIWGAA